MRKLRPDELDYLTSSNGTPIIYRGYGVKPTHDGKAVLVIMSTDDSGSIVNRSTLTLSIKSLREMAKELNEAAIIAEARLRRTADPEGADADS